MVLVLLPKVLQSVKDSVRVRSQNLSFSQVFVVQIFSGFLGYLMLCMCLNWFGISFNFSNIECCVAICSVSLNCTHLGWKGWFFCRPCGVGDSRTQSSA